MSNLCIRVPPSLINKLEKITNEAISNIAKREEEAAQQSGLWLPAKGDAIRIMPNHLARSSLFIPVKTGKKIHYPGTRLISRSDAAIYLHDEQLDEGMADVWMQAMHEAARLPLGEMFGIQRASFLRAIGRHQGKFEYDWLHRCLRSLASTNISVEIYRGDEVKLRISALPMIECLKIEAGTNRPAICIDPRWHKLYSSKEFAYIDQRKRLKIGQNKHMSKSLQRLIATSSNQIQRYSLIWLKEKLQFTSSASKFKIALTAALVELERAEIIGHWEIGISKKGNPQATWERL